MDTLVAPVTLIALLTSIAVSIKNILKCILFFLSCLLLLFFFIIIIIMLLLLLRREDLMILLLILQFFYFCSFFSCLLTKGFDSSTSLDPDMPCAYATHLQLLHYYPRPPPPSPTPFSLLLSLSHTHTHKLTINLCSTLKDPFFAANNT